MDIEEKFEELKLYAQKNLSQKDGIPVKIRNILEEIKEALKDKSKEMGANFPSVTEYIEGQFDVFNRTTLNRIGESRKNKKVEDFIHDIIVAKQALEKGVYDYILEERKREDRKEANSNTAKILVQMEYLLTDIYSQQRRILASRDINENKIEEISYEIKSYMRYFVSKCEDKMVGTFDEDNEEVRKFEKGIIEEIMNAKEENLTDRQKFEEELKNGAPTLEEQKEDAKRVSDTTSKIAIDEPKSLPDDVLK